MISGISILLKWFLLFTFLFSCAVNPVTGERELMLVSEEQELRIGREAAPSMKWEFGGQYYDSSLESYLGTIVTRLWKNSERPYLPMQFYIQNTSVPNAFALPGYVAITRGLLSDMDNEAQFAAVIGHEIGHVMARHTAQKISRMTLQQLGLAVGAAALDGKRGSDTLLTVGAIGSSLLLLKYDRNQEIQADRLGVKYMAELGYDPNEAISAHKILEKSVDNYLKRQGKSREEDNFITSLLSTHPETEVRLSEIRAMINELPPYTIKNDGRFGRRFRTAAAKMREINKIYFIYDKAEKYYQENNFNEAERKLKEAIKLNSSQAPFHNLLGFVKMQQKNYAEAEKSFRKALSIDSGYQPSIYGTGLVRYFEGNYNQAIRKFKKSLELYPDHALTHFGLGKSYLRVKQYSEAIPYLGYFAQAAPGNPEVHGLLGICYDMEGEIKPAVREYRYQLQVAPDTELGRHSKERLAVLEPVLKLR
ncbi:MAG TPA: tetratricopeptide repeat protein [Nitrospirae bacterium]|nr:TPR repeat-containing protein YfgC precursor [bacterium BMS3Abin06]HDH12631.1 tetratricopeptide repeat protein [Nitrospirota bacterium]HDZ02663.1 tetratricopeptide repeat protein [Nitrospirota bacterium]